MRQVSIKRGKRQEARGKQPLAQASMVFCRSAKDRRDASDKATIERLFCELATCDLRLATCDLRLVDLSPCD